MKIYDCSNSEVSLKAKGKSIRRDYGPKENDILRYLKQYASEFGHVFVKNPDDADVIFTNDIFPESFPGKKKVKRMDGVFARADMVHRNEALNQAAREADHVIFISDYSRESYFKLYDPDCCTLKSWSTIPNEVDPQIFYPGLDWSSTNYNTSPKEMIAVASDWSRPEKRLNDLLLLAEMAPNTDFILVGKVPDKVWPKNIRFKGYIDTPQKLADTLRMADGMVSFFYKDAYPKTMVQAKYCGLPVLYTNSGGQDQIGVSGIMVPDIKNISFDKTVPRLKVEDILKAWKLFKSSYKDLKEEAKWNGGRDAFVSMLKKYFNVLNT